MIDHEIRNALNRLLNFDTFVTADLKEHTSCWVVLLQAFLRDASCNKLSSSEVYFSWVSIWVRNISWIQKEKKAASWKINCDWKCYLRSSGAGKEVNELLSTSFLVMEIKLLRTSPPALSTGCDAVLRVENSNVNSYSSQCQGACQITPAVWWSDNSFEVESYWFVTSVVFLNEFEVYSSRAGACAACFDFGIRRTIGIELENREEKWTKFTIFFCFSILYRRLMTDQFVLL